MWGGVNLINVATNGLWHCRLRPVTFYIIKNKKRAQPREQQQQHEIHTHTHMQKENYKIYAHWPQRVPKRVPSRVKARAAAVAEAEPEAAAGDRQRGKRLSNFASCPAVANADAAAAHPLLPLLCCSGSGSGSGACVCVSLPLQMAHTRDKQQNKLRKCPKRTHTHSNYRVPKSCISHGYIHV